MEEGFEKKANIIILGTLLYTPNNVVVSTKPITRIEDFQGKKMRGWGKPLTLILQAWGGAGVVMSSGDVYMAMDRGTIDGVFSGMTSALSRKWYEVAKHVSIIRGFLPSPFNLGVNLDTWKKLHPDQKRAMIRAAHTAEVWCTKASIAEDDKAEKALVAKGVKVFVWPQDQAKKLRDLARPVIFEEQIRKPLGNEMVAKVEKWVEATRHSKMTWEQACQKNTERLLAKVK
jgi:TRAP-type C4-dicarboxylate transport system substrate-binding protein